jgi:DNA-binding response OmpR family regulator
MTILVVEADDAERHLLLKLCAQAGCTAVGVWEGRAALDYLQMTAAPVWVILLDLEIALADETLCIRLCYSHVGGVIPIVTMSARQDTASAAARLGIAAYLTKPFAPDTIDALVRCYAPVPRSRELGGIHDDPGDRR